MKGNCATLSLFFLSFLVNKIAPEKAIKIAMMKRITLCMEKDVSGKMDILGSHVYSDPTVVFHLI